MPKKATKKKRATKKATGKKRGRGRPTVWSAKVEEIIIEAASLGVSAKTACMAAGISERVFWDRMKADQDFSQKVHSARANGVLRHAREFSETDHKVRAHINRHYLAIHDGWVEKKHVEHSGSIGTFTDLVAQLAHLEGTDDEDGDG